MGKFKIGLQIDVTFLQQLSKEKSSGVSIEKSRHHVVMHPIHLKNFNGSVKELLNLGIAKFDKKLGGILLGYQNIKLINDKGVIHNDSNGIHVDLEGDFFVFKPEIGKELKGVLNRKGKDFVGVLVYNTFNVSIPKPQSTDDGDEWLGNDVQIGSEVLFQIQHVDTLQHLPYIRGELLSIISTPVNIGSDIENIQLKKGKPNKIVFEDSDTPIQNETTALSDQIEHPKKKKLKMKKNKFNKQTIEENEQETIQDIPNKSKKRKISHNAVEKEVVGKNFKKLKHSL